MTVEELIRELSHHPANLPVVTAGLDEAGYDDLVIVGTQNVLWNQGSRNLCRHNGTSDPKKGVPTLVLDRRGYAPQFDRKPAPTNPGSVESKRDSIVGSTAVDDGAESHRVSATGLDTADVFKPFPGTFYDNRLKDGTLVRAKAGGPLMMVEDIRADGVVSTVWFVDGICYHDVFHRDSLNIFVQVG